MNNFLAIIGKKEQKLYMFKGLTATKTIQTEITGNKKQKSLGNPIFDYLYQAFKKFGPHSDFIGSPSYT